LTVDAWTANHYRQQYRHVLVDEAQDLNLVQYEILRALCGRDSSNVVLVADKNQSIYGFGGAKPELLDRYLKEFTAKALPLTINFRSAVTITELANRLAQHFGPTALDQERMQATGGAPGVVQGRAYGDELAEAKGVASWIEALLTKGLDPAWISKGEDPYVGPEDVAVLARARFMLEEVHGELDKRNIKSVVRATEEGLFDSALGRLVYYWLRVASNGRDWPSRRRLYKLLAVEDGPGESDAIRFDELGALAISRGFPAPVVDLLVDAANHDVSQLIERITSSMPFDGTGHIDQLAWAHDQDELRRSWQRYAVLTEAHHRTLPDFLRALAQSQRAALDQPGVRLLTVHSAKGMEFRAVAIIGLNDGLFPYYLSLGHEDELNEERRSLYVAITRAARSLLLTRPVTRHTRYGTRRDEPSRFLGELAVALEATNGSHEVPF
jgi:DNA helicase-2/ATP-dependent DNA helicase PcrA